MTITKEEVLKLLDRMTFEVVNGELDRGLAEEIGKVLVAESARADQAEAATAAVAERAASKSETRHQLHLEQVRITNEWIADRDRLAAANAVLEAKVAGLVEAVKPFDAVGGTLFSKNWNMSDIVFDGGPMRSDCLFFEDFLNLRAALATQEAGT